MKIVKTVGNSAWTQRRLTMHGSTAERSLQISNGKFNRATEKPGNTFSLGNHNQRSRGSKSPKEQRP